MKILSYLILIAFFGFVGYTLGVRNIDDKEFNRLEAVVHTPPPPPSLVFEYTHAQTCRHLDNIAAAITKADGHLAMVEVFFVRPETTDNVVSVGHQTSTAQDKTVQTLAKGETVSLHATTAPKVWHVTYRGKTDNDFVFDVVSTGR